MRRLDTKFPETKAKFDRAAFRAVAWELMVGLRGQLARPRGRDRRRGPDAGAIDHGRAHRPVHVTTRTAGLRMTPEASLDAGLDVLVGPQARAAERPADRVAGVRLGAARAGPRHRVRRTTRSHVVVTAAEPFPVQVDGDPLGDHRRLEIELAPRRSGSSPDSSPDLAGLTAPPGVPYPWRTRRKAPPPCPRSIQIAPHGGTLVDLLATGDGGRRPCAEAANLPKLVVSERELVRPRDARGRRALAR